MRQHSRQRAWATIGALVSTLTLAGCTKDDDNDGNDGDKGRTSPAAASMIPGTFRNSVDEAGFKKKMPESAALLRDSASAFALRNSSVPSTRMNVGKAMMVGVAQRLDLPKSAVRRLLDEAAMGSEEPTAMLDEVDSLAKGDDCTALLVSLTDGYDQVLQSYSEAVQQIAATDFTQAPGFTKATPDTAQEAFAYDVALDSSKVQSSEPQSGTFALTGRFAGGANDSAVALRAAAKGTFSGEGAQGDFATDLNTYADITAKQLGFGLGLDLGMAGPAEDGTMQKIDARLGLETTLKGGATPAQTLKVSGGASSQGQSVTADLSVGIARVSATAMTLDVNGVFASDGQSKSIVKHVAMTISKRFGEDVCTVDSATGG